MPLSYFKFRDLDLLENAFSQLVFLLCNEVSLVNFVARLQFTLLLFDRIHWMGPLGFDNDEWTKGKALDIVTLLESVDKKCPVYLFKKQIRRICSRFKPVVPVE